MGAVVFGGKTRFKVRSPRAEALFLCLFDAHGREERIPMEREGVEHWRLELPEDLAGRPYGYRARGDWEPGKGMWFDEAKLLVDPHATQLDRRFTADIALTQRGEDTAHLIPRAIVMREYERFPKKSPLFRRGGLVYELNVRAFTMRHPEVPENVRGTVAALGHPAVVGHLKKMGVTAVELMPVIAWMNEPHLGPLGLVNAWGYNPIAFMALDPGLCPGGVRELARTVETLHGAGIGVLLDLVLNHTGEGDAGGNIVSLRGLDDSAYARAPDGTLVNDSGCGNTIDFGQDWIRELALDTMRHFVARCGIDGFRFDLAPIMARSPGFDAQAPIFAAMAEDEWLHDRVLIAEPWDIGPGGYQLGNFPPTWLEWNDKYRDDVRHYWNCGGGHGAMAHRLAGSDDLFGADCRSVNFLAAHDGFTLADSVMYNDRHNEANGEDNRDGHGANYSNNHGVEGPTDDPAIIEARGATMRAMLGSLFASTGTIMLTAGDEFGRTQRGNNNAYCQDNEIGWIDWENRDLELEDLVAQLSRKRSDRFARFPNGGRWLRLDGEPMNEDAWQYPGTPGFAYRPPDGAMHPGFTVDRDQRRVAIGVRPDWPFALPAGPANRTGKSREDRTPP